MIKFNTDGLIIPSFPFPDPIMDYIFKNLQLQHLIKLFQCSKWFWYKYGQNIIQHLEIVPDGESESFDFAKTVVCATNPVLKELADFWITDSLIDRTQIGFFPLFTHCTIKKLELNKLIFWRDYELLTKTGNIEEMKIAGVNGENGFASVDKIIAEIPNASSIEISECLFTATTCATLVSLKHKVKMTNLVLKNVTPVLFCYYELFFDFVLKNADDECNVYIDFKMIPEFDDLSRDFNALQIEFGKNICKGAAIRLETKELKKKIADSKNESFDQS